MAVKQIDYTVYKGGTITPLDIQEGGVQGEHRATILRFTLDDSWYNNLRTQTDGCRLIYHFEAYDGAGGKHCSDTAVLTEKWADYPLENFLTRYGGLVRVKLVLSLVDIKTGTCEREQHSFRAELRLIFAPHANTDGDEYESMASLAQAAKANKQLAEKYANEAKEAQAGTEAAASVLKQGTTFVFNGGTADGEVDADLIIDSEMSDYSSNPVQNRVIKGYIDKLHPVGSIFITSEKINPSQTFGGSWVLIDKSFKEQEIKVTQSTDESATNKGIEPRSYGGEYGYTLSGKVFLSNKTVRMNIGVKTFAGHNFLADGYGAFYLAQIRLSEYGINKIPGETGGTTIVKDEVNDMNVEHIWSYQEIPITSEYANNTNAEGISYHGGAMLSISSDGLLLLLDTIGGTYKKNEETGEMVYGIDFIYKGKQQPIWIDITFPVMQENMLDSFCDKFYWQRTE